MSRVPLPMAQVALSAMNHVLQQQPASRERMRAHAGCCIRIVASHPFGTLESDAMVGPDGLLVAIARGTPDVVLRIAPRVDGLLRVLDEGTRALRSQLSIEGDAALAATVSEVADALEWDFEEDLSRVVGDPIAHRVGLAVRGLRARFGGLRERSAEAAHRAAVSRGGPLVSGADLAGLAAEIGRMAERIDRLESRAGRPAR